MTEPLRPTEPVIDAAQQLVDAHARRRRTPIISSFVDRYRAWRYTR